MKKVISLIISALIVALSALSAGALTSSSYPGIVFANDFDDNLAVTEYTGDNPVVSIPQTLFMKNVVRFYEGALANNKVVETVIMNDLMTKVGIRAFYSCEKLKNVYYSKSLKVIDEYAFAYDKKLKTALLRNTNLSQLAAGAYTESGVEYVALPDSIEDIEEIIFNKTNVRRVVIPSGANKIGARCFADDVYLKEIYVPASVTRVGKDVFLRSNNVTVYTVEGSAMHSYCENSGVNYKLISEEEFPSRLLGDTDGNGVLNVNDATLIQCELAGYDTDFYADNCDFDCDCKLSINDATAIQFKILEP